MTSTIKESGPGDCPAFHAASQLKKMIEKAASIKVDGVILDLEDSVAPDLKESAQSSDHRQALLRLGWKASSVSIRIICNERSGVIKTLIELVSSCSEKNCDTGQHPQDETYTQ